MISQKGYIQSSGKHCPHCNSTNVTADGPEVDGATILVDVTCNDCKAAWTDQFKLSGFLNFEAGKIAA